MLTVLIFKGRAKWGRDARSLADSEDNNLEDEREGKPHRLGVERGLGCRPAFKLWTFPDRLRACSRQVRSRRPDRLAVIRQENEI